MMRKSRRSSTNKEMICDYKTKCVIKIVKQIMFISLLAILVMGCSFKKEDNNYQYYSISKPEVDAYKLFLTEKLENPQKNRETGFKVALIRLDEDDIYEMALLRKDGDKYRITMYEYSNDQVIELGIDGYDFYDSPGRTFAYLEGKNCFFEACRTIKDEDVYFTKNIFSISNRTIYLDKALLSIWSSYEANNLETVKYYINDEEVSDVQFNNVNYEYDLNQDIDSNPIVPAGFYELRADYLTEVNSKKDLEKALSEDYFIFYSACYREKGGKRHSWGE